MKNKTLQDFRDAFFGDDDRKDAGDKHFYGVVKSLKTNANGKVVGYYVNLGGDSGTTYCRKLAGAKVGNTVMVTLMGNSKVATVTGTLNGDTDVEDVKEPLDDLIGRVDDGEFTPAGTVIQYCLATAMVIPTGGSFDDIQYTDWSEDLPAYQVGYYYWMRTVTVMEDETEIESEPVFALSAQTAAEANDIATSTNNYFWHDNTGAWITKVDQATYQTSPTGPAVQLGASGTADYLDGIMLASRTASGTTLYCIDSGVRKELVTYGLSGTVFNSDYPFTIGNNNSYIKWERDSSTQQWKIKIAADVIEMGGTPIHNGEDGGRWYTGTGITGTSSTAQVFSGSGVTMAVVGDMYLNTSTSNTYRCTKAGGPSVAEWVYECNIKGDPGNDGDDGDDGQDGRGVLSTEVKYATSSSGTSEPSTGWQSSVPSVSAGYYLWTRTVVKYTDNTSTTLYSVARQGEDGSPGTDITSQYMWFQSSGTYAGLNIKYTNYNNRTILNANGLTIYDGNGYDVANFGNSSSCRLGWASGNNVVVDTTGMKFKFGSTQYAAITIGTDSDYPYSNRKYIGIGGDAIDVYLTNSGGATFGLYSPDSSWAYLWETELDLGLEYGLRCYDLCLLDSSTTGRMLRCTTENDTKGAVCLGNGKNNTRIYGNKVLKGGGSNEFSTSDIRFKDHIKPLDYASRIILNADTFEYRWISDWNPEKEGNITENPKKFGVSAQNIIQLLKDIGIEYEDSAIVTKEGDRFYVSFESFIPLLIRTVQDLNARVVQLEGRVA